jgi:hypothetical protein
MPKKKVKKKPAATRSRRRRPSVATAKSAAIVAALRRAIGEAGYDEKKLRSLLVILDEAIVALRARMSETPTGHLPPAEPIAEPSPTEQ